MVLKVELCLIYTQTEMSHFHMFLGVLNVNKAETFPLHVFSLWNCKYFPLIFSYDFLCRCGS